MAESPTVNVDSRGIAMVVWRGYNGYDGDLFYAMSDVSLGNWTVPRTLTDDDASSWLATTAIDSDKLCQRRLSCVAMVSCQLRWF
ncbi:MAG: hypothetical protein ACE5PV_03075 [Candidatus Poribacteria bacterium]